MVQAVWRPNRKVWGVGLIGGDAWAEEINRCSDTIWKKAFLMNGIDTVVYNMAVSDHQKHLEIVL